MSKIDYAFKSKVLNEHSELLEKVRKCSLFDYSINNYVEYGIISNCLTREGYFSMSELKQQVEEEGLIKEYQECLKISHASYNRVKRLKTRVKEMLLNGVCTFVTLTFSNETLETTTPKERRVAVSRYLKQYGCKYVANIDFGKTNHREHYHALINSDKLNYKAWSRYGSIDYEKVRNRNIETDNVRLSKYIAKLSNHAIKETTNRSALIYSR